LINQVFGGSAASLVLHLVETGDLTEDDLREIRKQMASSSGAKKGGKK
jgi:predicted transcriptional regulator